MPPRPERIGERLRGERDGEYARAFPRLDVGGGGDCLRGVVHRGDGVLRRLRRARACARLWTSGEAPAQRDVTLAPRPSPRPPASLAPAYAPRRRRGAPRLNRKRNLRPRAASSIESQAKHLSRRARVSAQTVRHGRCGGGGFRRRRAIPGRRRARRSRTSVGDVLRLRRRHARQSRQPRVSPRPRAPSPRPRARRTSTLSPPLRRRRARRRGRVL